MKMFEPWSKCHLGFYTDSDNELLWNKQQTINWTNDVPMHKCSSAPNASDYTTASNIYLGPGLDI